MKLFQVSFSTLIVRFYLLMLIVIVAGFSGYWMIALLALPVFFTALMGIQFNRKIIAKKTHPSAQQDMNRSLQQNAARA
jgi:hypothetical protein